MLRKWLQFFFFLHILERDIKNRVIKRQLMRFGKTISRKFNNMLIVVLRCYKELLKQLELFPKNSSDPK